MIARETYRQNVSNHIYNNLPSFNSIHHPLNSKARSATVWLAEVAAK